MVTRDTPWPVGTACWIELAVSDIDQASKFYAGLFGWEIQAAPDGYAICLKNGRAVAGIGRKQDPQGPPAVWTTYLASDNVDETVAKVQAAGGKVLQEPIDAMDASRIAVAADPAGAVFGIWQARAHIGVGLVDEPGSLTWVENWSSDSERNRAFYHAVFGYRFIDIRSENPRYAVMSLDGYLAGGIGDLRSDLPSQWFIHFAVDHPHQAVAGVVELGGSVEYSPSDTPYGLTAMLRDNQGATFGVTRMTVSVCPHGRPTFDVKGLCMASPPCP